jgi:hypothetical protein
LNVENELFIIVDVKDGICKDHSNTLDINSIIAGSRANK